MKKEEVGHNFLARLGKTRLRPGGKLATDWLIANADFNANKKVLEVACNMCTTAIQIAKQYGCEITGVDLDEEALEKARHNIKENGVEDLVKVQRANAKTFSGEMSLLSPKGLIYDEGVLGAMKIISNALKPENRDTFKKMFNTFNDPDKKLGFIAICSQK